MARARLLDVPRRQRRDRSARTALGVDDQSQLRRPPRPRRAHPPRLPGDGRSRCGARLHHRRPRAADLAMQKFTVHAGIAAPLPRANVNTDVLIRIERLVYMPRGQLGRYCFEAWRYRADGSEDPEFVLNRPAYRKATILLAGANFGCGSSREAAVWSLSDMGFRCVIAASFGDIFFNNCFQTGMLPIVLPAP